MSDFDNGDFDIHREDAIAVGCKVITAANSAKLAHSLIPGATATWWFQIDDTRFQIVITVANQAEVVTK